MMSLVQLFFEVLAEEATSDAQLLILKEIRRIRILVRQLLGRLNIIMDELRMCDQI